MIFDEGDDWTLYNNLDLPKPQQEVPRIRTRFPKPTAEEASIDEDLLFDKEYDKLDQNDGEAIELIEEISDTDLDASNRAPPILTEELW